MVIAVKMALIDLDGTMVDSVPDIAVSVDETMQALSMPNRGEQQVRLWVGNGVERLVKRSLINRIDGEPDSDLYAKALPVFMQKYAANNGRYSRVYDGVHEGIAYLKSIGIRVGCVTNKAKAFTEPLLKQLGLFDAFELVVSGDSLARKKPDPLPLLHAADFFQVAPSQALMIGDSVSDVKAARNAGFMVLCVSYGYNHGQDIRVAEPDLVVDSMLQLRDNVQLLH